MKKKYILALFILTLAGNAFAGDFVTQFLNKYVVEKRPVNNVNIGKTMLNKIISNTGDESLKVAFKDLNNIRIITSENKKDANFYFKKAEELVSQEFTDFQELVSVNEKKNKMGIFIREKDKKNQEIILISLDNSNKLTIITITGRIDLTSLSRLFDTFLSKDTEAADDTGAVADEK